MVVMKRTIRRAALADLLLRDATLGAPWSSCASPHHIASLGHGQTETRVNHGMIDVYDYVPSVQYCAGTAFKLYQSYTPARFRRWKATN